jgi:hypothetical protein
MTPHDKTLRDDIVARLNECINDFQRRYVQAELDNFDKIMRVSYNGDEISYKFQVPKQFRDQSSSSL